MKERFIYACMVLAILIGGMATMGLVRAQEVQINTDISGRVTGITTVDSYGQVTYSDRNGASTGGGALPVNPYATPPNYSIYTPSPYTPNSTREALRDRSR
jgi:hypothetical protein